MNLVVIKLIDLILQLVHCPFTIYIALLILEYYVCHCNFDFFCKFYIYIYCKIFSEIKLLLTYFAATSGITGLKPGQVRFWAYTLAWTEKKNMAAILHFLQLILIWVWNINEAYVFFMKCKVPCSLGMGGSVFNHFLSVFYENHYQGNFLSVVLENIWGNIQQYLFTYEINDK